VKGISPSRERHHEFAPLSVMAGHSRSKNGVASARLCPAIHVFLADTSIDVDARHKAGHDVLQPLSRAQGTV